MHELINVDVPLIAILAGILLNRLDFKELRSERNARFNAVDTELRYFHGLTGKLEALEKREKQARQRTVALRSFL